jgi:hypothetical protein
MAYRQAVIRGTATEANATMNFEFLIAYRRVTDTDIEPVLVEALTKVLEDNFNDFESEVVRSMIRLRHERAGKESADEDGNVSCHTLLAFTLDLPDETAQMQTVVKEFPAALAETPPIFHAVKFEDPLLRADLARYAEEIFALEMKLRRVLTLIYLYANQDAEPYDLLRDESVQPMKKEKLEPEQMQAAAENQFFHLTFGQYISLNERPEFKLPALLSVARDADTYDAFRAELDRAPIEHEDDAGLVASLKEQMDAIETMRNCVAHNRRPNRRAVENYDNARPLLDQTLDEYLARWEKAAPRAIPGDLDEGNPGEFPTT